MMLDQCEDWILATVRRSHDGLWFSFENRISISAPWLFR
jgi:hypothetical protein